MVHVAFTLLSSSNKVKVKCAIALSSVYRRGAYHLQEVSTPPWVFVATDLLIGHYVIWLSSKAFDHLDVRTLHGCVSCAKRHSRIM